MKRTLLLTFLLLSVSALCFSQKLVEVAKGYSCTSVNTTIFRNNSLVTHGDEQYISYYDADGYLVLGKRKLNSKQWTLHRTQYRGNVKDAHNIISIMVDGEGDLHVSFDHHGHKLNYCRSGRRECYLSGILPSDRRGFVVCLPFRFFRTWKSGDEPLFIERP